METTTTSNFRRRVPFIHSVDGEEENDNRIMDDEEQEAVINDLRERSSAANKQFLLAMQGFVLLSMYIHFIFFLMSYTTNPLSILLPSTSTSPRPVLSRLLDLIALFVQFNIILGLSRPGESTLFITRWAHSLPYLPLSRTATLSVASALPAVALLARYEWQIVAWHAISVILAGVVQTVQQWIKEGEEGIGQLEGLRYDARGA